jgi:hypothetical protein
LEIEALGELADKVTEELSEFPYGQRDEAVGKGYSRIFNGIIRLINNNNNNNNNNGIGT